MKNLLVLALEAHGGLTQVLKLAGATGLECAISCVTGMRRKWEGERMGGEK